MNQESTYTPKNILITGGAGFIASHLVIHFVKTYPDYNIVNIDKMDYCSSLQNLKEIEGAPNYTFVKGDIQSVDLINYVLENYNIDSIIHAAAQSHVDNSFGNSFHFTSSNIMGTHVLLEAAKNHGIKRFIHVSTDEVYGETVHADVHDESSILAPTNPYAATKAGAELLVQAYYRSFKLPVIITRGNNVYGPHQYPEKLIPKCCMLLLQDKSIFLHGTGSNKRSFIYIDDVVSAFDCILHKGQIGEIYNIGTSVEISNLQVAKDILALFGMDESKIEFVKDRPFNDFRYFVKFDKLTSLGWERKVEWKEGLEKTIEWYRNVPADYWVNVQNALVAHPRNK